MDPGDLVQLRRNRPERAVKREGHVPDLAGEDHHDAGQLEPDVRRRKEGDHPEDETRHEAEDRDPLADVEERDHHLLGPLRVSGDGPVDEGKGEREEVRREAARQREQGVSGQRQRGEVDLDGGPDRRVPALGQEDDPRDEGAERAEQEKVDAEALEPGGTG